MDVRGNVRLHQLSFVFFFAVIFAMQNLDISIKNSHRTAVAEARESNIHIFYVEASRKCVLQEFVIVSFTFLMNNI